MLFYREDLGKVKLVLNLQNINLFSRNLTNAKANKKQDN